MAEGEVTPELIISLANRHARGICWHHPGWDKDGLAGDIIEACVRWPPRRPAEVTMRAKWATADWFQRAMGTEGQKEAIAAAMPFSTFESPSGDEIEPGFGRPIETDEFSFIHDSDVASKMIDLLPNREGRIIRLLLDGHKMAEACEVLGISRVTGHRIMTQKIRPLLEVLTA